MAQMSRYKICIITFVTLVAFASLDLLQAQTRSSDTYIIISDVIGIPGTIATPPGDVHKEHLATGQAMSIVSSDSGGNKLFSGFIHPKMKQTGPMVNLYFEKNTTQPQFVDENSTLNLQLSLADGNSIPEDIWVKVKFQEYDSDNIRDYSIAGTTEDSISIKIAANNTDSDPVVITIEQDTLLEGVETITASIVDITANSGIPYSITHRSLITQDTIKINANDNFSISGDVYYEGNQTGILVVAAYTSVSRSETSITINSNPVAITRCSFDVNDIYHGFTLKDVPIDENYNYTIVAFIDSDAGTSDIMESWESAGYYEIQVGIEEDSDPVTYLNTVITINDPSDRFDNQYANDTSTYADWVTANKYSFASEQAKGAYLDSDHDGYSNFWEYVNGTDPLVPDDPYLYAGYDPTTDTTDIEVDEKYQFVYTSPSSPNVFTNNFVTVDLKYDNYDSDFCDNENENFICRNYALSGLGIAVHFDSTKLDFAGYSGLIDSFASANIYPLTPLASNPNTYSWYSNIPNTENTTIADDGYTKTNKAIALAWHEPQNLSWPGVGAEFPFVLARLTFKAKDNWEGVSTTVVRFTATSTDARYQFYASPVTITLGDFNLDIDNNGKVLGMSDGILVMRYLYGLMFDGQVGQTDIIADNATRKLPNEIFSFLHKGRDSLDVDGSGKPDALTDGLIILRHLLLETENEIIVENAISLDADRKTAKDIVPYIKQLIPQ